MKGKIFWSLFEKHNQVSTGTNGMKLIYFLCVGDHGPERDILFDNNLNKQDQRPIAGLQQTIY